MRNNGITEKQVKVEIKSTILQILETEYIIFRTIDNIIKKIEQFE